MNYYCHICRKHFITHELLWRHQIKHDNITMNYIPNNKLQKPIIKQKIRLIIEIDNLLDLIEFSKKIDVDYLIKPDIEYNIDLQMLKNLLPDMINLNNMIGQNKIKNQVANLILYYSLHLNKKEDDLLHTIIDGEPGTGKTEFAQKIAKIYLKMGVLKKDIFKKVKRSDLIAGYLGQTAIKTRDIIKECLGGVLFIDEAYALGNEEKKDSFSKECIDTLCEALSDHKDNLMVIIAGYENSLNNCFFNYNPGLQSRFTWRFKTDEYNAQDLYKIFIKKVNDGGWSLAEDSYINVKWFEKNKSHFKYYGRDIETLFAKTKIAHSRRVFCKPNNVKTKITMKDLENGFEMYINNDEVKKRADNNDSKVIQNMYL